MTDDPYRIAVDRERGFVHMKLSGFWDVATAERFIDDYAGAMTEAAAPGRDIRLLLDQQAMAVQSAETARMLETMLATGRPLPGRAAIVSSRALVRMQGKRMKAQSINAWFDTEATALAWLLSDDDAPAADSATRAPI